MTRVSLTKYGFIRNAEGDFTDDGSHFNVFQIGCQVRVTKHVSNGQVYLSASIDGNLPYEIYSELPSYRTATWRYNGVSVSSLTEEDLNIFAKACLSYEKEYTDAENSLVYPSLEEITAQCKNIQLKRAMELAEVKKLLSERIFDAVLKFSEYEWRTMKNYAVELSKKLEQYNPEKLPQKILGHASSIAFVKSNNNELRDCYYYRYIVELFEKRLAS